MLTELTYKYYNGISGIYAIKSLFDERQYIGSAVNIHNRYCVHRHLLKKGKHHSKHLQNFYNKYGEESLEFRVLDICSKEKLKEREQYFLDSYNKAFNNSPTATSNLGLKRHPLTDEHKKKISLSSRGHKKSQETKARMSKAFQGHRVKETTRGKIGEANRKINNEKRIDIYRKYIFGIKVEMLAIEYSVCLATIYNAIKAFEILESKL